MEVTYQIPVNKIYETHKHLLKLQKRANKAGQEAVFTFAFDDEVKTHKFRAENVEGQGDIITSYKYRVLRVNQDITVHEGWTPIAKLDVTEKKMRCYNTYQKEIETLGDKMWTKHCDHCGHNKIVHTAFVMQNGDKFMKVGKGCMKELAPASAAQIAREFDIYALWSDYLAAMTAPEGCADGSFNGRGGSGGMSVEYVYAKSDLILTMRAALEITSGWVTSKYSEGDRYGRGQEIINRGHRTFDFIQGLLNRQLCLIPDQKYVDSVNADVNLCLAKYSHLIGTEEKLTELRNFADSEKARVIDIFLIKNAQDIIKREVKKESQREMSGHHFNDGEKVILEVKEIEQFSFQGAYGTQFVVMYQTKCGKIVKYVGSSPQNFIPEELNELRLQYTELISKSHKLQNDARDNNDLIPQAKIEMEKIDRELDEIEVRQKLVVKPEWFKIQGTVKHDNYKGPETKLLRIKQIFEKKKNKKNKKI